MSQQTQDSDSAEFGPNQWLVDVLREQWREDPSSVDPSWAEHFASTSSAGAESPGTTGPGTETSGTATAPSTASEASAPAPSSAPDGPSAEDRPAAPADAAPAASSPDPAPTAPAAAAPSPAVPSAASSPAKESPAVNASSESASPRTPSVSTTSDRPAKVPTTTAQIPAVELREPEAVKLRGPAAAVVRNMDESLGVPTATSVRDVPVKLLFDNRLVINNHLKRHRAGKVSFTHLIGWAMVEAVTEITDMNNGFDLDEKGKPLLMKREDVNFGLAIDMPRPDGSRGLVVPNIKAAQRFDFHGFWKAYEEVVKKARSGKLTMDDFTGTTVSLTNPGGIGTVHSIPRLMQGQGVIVGVGAMDYPAQFQGASPATLAELAVSKVMTLTSTYDHRIIQGAASGEFLKRKIGRASCRERV